MAEGFVDIPIVFAVVSPAIAELVLFGKNRVGFGIDAKTIGGLFSFVSIRGFEFFSHVYII